MMKYRIALVALAAAVALSACARTKQVSVSGDTKFLTPEVAAKLEPSEDKFSAAERYLASETPLSGYDKVLIDPIMFMTPRDEAAEITAQNKQRMADSFHQLLSQELGKDFKLVTAPEAGAFRLQVAVVKATKKNVALDTVSTVTPIGIVGGLALDEATGTPVFTGQLAIEAEITDAVSGDLLAAAVDARAGGKEWTKDQFEAWPSVAAAMQFYAKLARYRFCIEGGRTECVEPPAQFE